MPNVRLISLQRTHGLEQLEQLPAGMTVETLGEFDAGDDAFVDTAAIMNCLDLVITSDTAIPHLAGALGRAGLGGAQAHPRLALDARTERQSVVSLAHAVPSARARRLGQRHRRNGASTARARTEGLMIPSVPISWGELVDKITILEIKSELLSSANRARERQA